MASKHLFANRGVASCNFSGKVIRSVEIGVPSSRVIGNEGYYEYIINVCMLKMKNSKKVLIN